MQRLDHDDVGPANDEQVRIACEACRQYLEDLGRTGIGPQPNNLHQQNLLLAMGELLPAVLARLERVEGNGGIYRAA